MADAHVVAEGNVPDPNYHIKVTNGGIVADFATAGVDDAQPNPHAPPNLVTKEETITRTLEKGWQESHAGERGQPEFARFSHADGDYSERNSLASI
jgi:hypothetical protein